MKLFVAVPTLWTIRTETAQFLIKLQGQQECQIQFAQLVPHTTARNELARAFLKSDCTHILFIDDDIYPHNFEKILESDKDVIWGYSYVKRWNNIVPNFTNGKEEAIGFWDNDIVEVKYLGFGFMKITREVVHKLMNEHYKICEFHFDKLWRLEVWEDCDFCDKVRAIGFKVHLHWAVKCSHYKTIDIANLT